MFAYLRDAMSLGLCLVIGYSQLILASKLSWLQIRWMFSLSLAVVEFLFCFFCQDLWIITVLKRKSFVDYTCFDKNTFVANKFHLTFT